MGLMEFDGIEPFGVPGPEIDISVGGGVGGGFHFYGGGVFAHTQVQCGSGGCFSITTVCGRIGAGMYLGGGTEGGGSIGQSNEECEEPCTETWSVGVGGDIALGNEGAGGGAGGGPSGFSASGNIRSPLSLGLGFSGGIDICYIKICPLF